VRTGSLHRPLVFGGDRAFMIPPHPPKKYLGLYTGLRHAAHLPAFLSSSWTRTAPHPVHRMTLAMFAGALEQFAYLLTWTCTFCPFPFFLFFTFPPLFFQPFCRFFSPVGLICAIDPPRQPPNMSGGKMVATILSNSLSLVNIVCTFHQQLSLNMG